MEKFKSKQIIIGLLFITATISYLVGSRILESIFKQIIENKEINRLSAIIAISLEIINIFSVIVIGFLFLFILKQYHSKLPSIYFVSRLIEGILLTSSIVSIFPLLFGDTSFINPNSYIKMYHLLFQIGMLFLGIGSLFLMALFWKENMIPQALCMLGVISYVSLTISCLLEIMHISSNFTMLLYLPGTIFEIAFPIWLIRKGVVKNGNTSK